MTRRNRNTTTRALASLAFAAALLGLTAASAVAAPAFEVDFQRGYETVTRGDEALDYAVKVKNTGADPTAGAVTAEVEMPGGLLTSFIGSTGTGWSCIATPAAGVAPAKATCTRADALAAGASYPTLTVFANLGADSPEHAIATATVSGGGAATQVESDEFDFAPAVPFDLVGLDVVFTDSAGAPSMQAGSHPYAWTTSLHGNTVKRIGFDADGNPQIFELPNDDARDVLFEFPPGLVGNPFAVPRCEAVDFVENECPDSSVVGVIENEISFGEKPSGPGKKAIYNLLPPPGVAAKFGFLASTNDYPVTIEAKLNPDPPYNIIAGGVNIPQAVSFYGSDLTVWGNPASSVHDGERCKVGFGSCPASVPERAFVTLPRRCTGPLATHVEARSWQEPDKVLGYDLQTHDNGEPPQPLGTSGCSKLAFNPQISSQPTTDQAESPSGLAFNLDVVDPGLQNPDGVARSDIKKAVVTLPEGMTVNPSQAEGLLGCTPGQFDGETVDSEPGEGCPEASKIGNVEVETPLLEGEILRGSLFVAEPFDNPFDSLIALYMTVKSPKYGVNVGLAGKVEPDPVTGQLVTTFGDPAGGSDFEALPQLPFSHFRLKFREGGRSPLITPPTCDSDPSTPEHDPYVTTAEFTPWANPDNTYTTTSSFEVTKGVGGGPCPSGGQPFEPGFEAGSHNNNGGSYSTFAMRLTRRDGDQDLTRFDATLPPGMVAKLAGVSFCPDAAIAQAKANTGKQELASPACPAGSKIGTVQAGAGVGSQLTYVPGSVYLAGPFGGAPLSVVGVVPAVAGPFDVGTVVTRQALVVDPRTAEVKVDGALSDPIPHILAGIPLRVRDIQVYVDRPEFTLNPTSCDPFATVADIWGGGANVFSSADDSPVGRSTRFQAANCSRLGFKPRLTLKLKGGTKRGGHPALRAVLRPRPGDANLSGAVVRLPRSAFLDQGHIRTICTRVQFAADACPTGAVYGRVRAFSPLLEDPLEGPAYLRSSNNDLPDLVYDLHGLVDIESSARIDSVKGGIRASFTGIPDAPLSRVVVTMQGGKKGLIVNSRDLCAHRSKAQVRFTGQNGKRYSSRPRVRPRCGKRR